LQLCHTSPRIILFKSGKTNLIDPPATANLVYRTTEHISKTPPLNLIEKAYDNAGAVDWCLGAFSVKPGIPRTCLAAWSFPSAAGISIRVYYGALNNRLLEKCIDQGGWYDGCFNQPSIPGTEAAVITWGQGASLNLRVYFQNGTFVTGVSE
jgi:hypothetical protein